MSASMLATLRLVAAHAGYTGSEPTASSSGAPQLQVPSGPPLVGLATIARHIASESSSATKLLGSSPEQQAQVNEWLSWASSELQPLVDDKLFKVNDFLLSRTYLVGSSLTLADLVVFGVTHEATTCFPVAQTLHFSALLRWARHIQDTADTAIAFPAPLCFNLPSFVPPPPPAPSAPRAPAPGAAAASAAAAKAPVAAAAAAPAAAAAAKPAGKPAAAPDAAVSPAASAASAAPPAAEPAAGTAAAEASTAAAGALLAKKDKKDKSTAAAGGGGGGGGKKAVEEEEACINQLNIVVGTIVSVEKHPNADSLYLEQIDVGEDKPRQVISGLAKFVPLDKMLGRRVLVVLNLKPAKMRDVMSYGMVLCASNAAHDQVDPVEVPAGVPNGERVTWEGFAGEPMAEVNPKKKLLERLFPDMKTDAAGVPNYKGAVFQTSKGPITSSLPNGSVA